MGALSSRVPIENYLADKSSESSSLSFLSAGKLMSFKQEEFKTLIEDGKGQVTQEAKMTPQSVNLIELVSTQTPDDNSEMSENLSDCSADDVCSMTASSDQDAEDVTSETMAETVPCKDKVHLV